MEGQVNQDKSTRVALDERELESIRAALIDRPKLDRIFEIHLTDNAGNVHASIEKTIHIRRKAIRTHIRFGDF